MIDEKVYALPEKIWSRVHERLLKAGFDFLWPIRAGEALLEGYWQAPRKGPVVAVWLRPLTHHDMKLAGAMCGGADRGLVAGAAHCSNFARFYLYFEPFEKGPRFPRVNADTAQRVWDQIDTVMRPFGRYVAGTELDRPLSSRLSPWPYRYNVGPGK